MWRFCNIVMILSKFGYGCIVSVILCFFVAFQFFKCWSSLEVINTILVFVFLVLFMGAGVVHCSWGLIETPLMSQNLLLHNIIMMIIFFSSIGVIRNSEAIKALNNNNNHYHYFQQHWSYFCYFPDIFLSWILTSSIWRLTTIHYSQFEVLILLSFLLFSGQMIRSWQKHFKSAVSLTSLISNSLKTEPMANPKGKLL